MSSRRDWSSRKAVWRSNFGRSDGWIVESPSGPIARLVDPRWDDMFWTDYGLVPVTEDPVVSESVLTREYWEKAEEHGLRYRSVALDEYAEHALPALRGPELKDGEWRLSMRALYVRYREPRLLESLLMRLGY